MVLAHSNQARITQFAQHNCKVGEIVDDADVDCFYEKDVLNFAIKKGLVSKDTDIKDFSFSDTYCPLNFDGARFAEARTWSFYQQLSSDFDGKQYLDYVSGLNYKNRMPLFIKPTKKVSVEWVQLLLGDHFTGTALDFSGDEGAGPYHLPYRWRPLTWSTSTHNKETYFNERSAGTQQTGWTFVAESRKWLPDHLGGRIWWGPDDAATSPYVPFYSANNRIPQSYGKPYLQGRSVLDYDFNNIFWIVNHVANWAYTRYQDIAPIILEEKHKFHEKMQKELATAEVKLAKYPKGRAIKIATKICNHEAKKLLKKWQKLFGYLFARFRDGYVIEKSDGPVPNVTNPGYGEPWYNRIIAETGNRYKEPEANNEKSDTSDIFGLRPRTAGSYCDGSICPKMAPRTGM
jgi:dipeptidase